jgi:hypothetical protein
MQKQFIPRKTDRRFVPLSFAQERLWLLNQLEPESSAYHTATALRLDGTLDIGALRSALDARTPCTVSTPPIRIPVPLLRLSISTFWASVRINSSNRSVKKPTSAERRCPLHSRSQFIMSNPADTRIDDSHGTCNPLTTQTNFSTLPLLCQMKTRQQFECDHV